MAGMSIDSHSFFLKATFAKQPQQCRLSQDLLCWKSDFERRFGTIFMIVPSLPDLKVGASGSCPKSYCS